MRRISAAITALFLVLCMFGTAHRILQKSTPSTPSSVEEIHAIWLSYIDLSMHDETGNSREAFEKKADTICKNITSHRIHTVFFHARAFSDAFYRSERFPMSACLSGTQGKDVGYDPLEIFCAYAEKYGVTVHAWINPFRICSDASKWNEVSEQNPAKYFLNDEDPSNDIAVVQTAGGYYYNPASAEVQDLIENGVCELLQNYPIAGIHIDDYFYPSQDECIDAANYDVYKQTGGKLSLEEWRRETVSAWVQRMYRTVKQYGEDKVFSISPAANLQTNYHSLYADVERWCAETGYCDWIIPQLYVGFSHESLPFDRATAQWNALVRADNVRLMFGLAAYKSGQVDDYAGSGKDEWKTNNDILSREIVFSRTDSACSGFVFYSYSSFFGKNATNNAKNELQFVTSVL